MRYSSFVKQSQLILDRLTTIEAQVKQFKEETAFTPQQKSKISMLDTIAQGKFNEFERAVAKLFTTTPLPEELEKEENVSTVSSLQDKIGDIYVSIHTMCLILVPKPVSVDRPNLDDSTTNSAAAPMHIQLPRIQLGTFSGQAENWMTFRNIFENAIHKNESIASVEKMSYLLSCLEGEALSVVKALPVTSANYFIAWEALNKRYHNTRMLISLHVNNVLDLPVVHNPSLKQLRQFISVLNENSQALRALNQDIAQESLFLTSLLLRKFDMDMRQNFEKSRTDSNVPPKLDEFVSFLEAHCSHLEAANLTNAGPSHKSNSSFATRNVVQHKVTAQRPYKTALLVSSRNVMCTFCSSHDHNIYQCKRFSNMSPQDRFNAVKEKGLCRNCLGDRHTILQCKSHNTCSTCKKRHHSLIHFNMPHTSHSPSVSKNVTTVHGLSPAETSSNKVTSNFVGLTNGESTVLLATVLVVVKSTEGKSIVCRGILDSAAQSTFITEKCAQILGLKRNFSCHSLIKGISSAQVRPKGLCHLSLSSLSGDILATSHPVLILDKITQDLPRAKISSEVRGRMKNLMLADPTFDTPAPVDILIGADLFALSIKGHTIPLGKDMPVAIETIFGYAILGSTPVQGDESNNRLVTLLSVNDLDLHSSIQRFWTQEDVSYESPKCSPQDMECEKHFLTTHSRSETGRYIVSLPFSDEPTKLGDSSKLALNMFLSLERKFASNPKFKNLYINFMQDYLSKGHMKLCSSPPEKDFPHYYLPHHGVLKDEKIRVVFNASAPTSTSVSLNNILHPGPKLQNDIVDIILHFRRHAVVFTCDICQMFRQVQVCEQDQLFQLIYWRENTNCPIQVYKLTTVTYGMTSSPYLANRVIQQLIQDEGAAHPLASSALKEQIYVDDSPLGSDSVENALILQKDVIHLLKKGGFELSKWSSNHPSLLEAIPQEQRGSPIGFCSPEQPLYSVLGLKWIPNEDVFSYTVNIDKTISTPTKRTVISSIAQIYDPVGWLTPVSFWAKAFMQHLWTLGLSWDEPLSEELSTIWKQFLVELPLIQDLKIPRYLGLASTVNIQLHAFSDASEAGYCGCVYIRVINSKQQIFTHLLLAKSRVAPLKRISLPRLELCGAHLVSKLLHHCLNQLSPHYKIDSVSAWCDSTIVLNWIKTPSYRLKVYVSNRVAEIQEKVPPELWLHITSTHNPADCGSRGLSPHALSIHPLWWDGPSWLKNSCDTWPISVINPIPQDSLPETKPFNVITLSVTSVEPIEVLTHFSSWTTLLHVFGFMLRFISNTRKKTALCGNLTLEELQNANLKICKLVQLECFSEELALLIKGQPCSTRLRRLSPYLDKEGIIRVGGRLQHASVPHNVKHPILLPKSHHVVNILIDYYHTLCLHSGPTLVQAMLSRHYWILSARSVIRSRIFKCIKCFRSKPPVSMPLMGDLPKSRVTPTRPFSVSGVDYAGPFYVKQHLLRRVQPIKVYLCIFICFSTKAIHIEVVTDLTTDAYIAALTRFISRRGMLTDIHSDNATNFVGAALKLKRQFEDLIKHPKTQHFAEKSNFKFHFLPPSSPHQGGLWERAVQSAKHHLTRVLGQQILTLEEFITLSTRIEAMLNSRPITPMSSDPSDLEALTPGHFLVGGPLMAPLEPNLETVPVNRLQRWQMVQHYFQHIWSRWQQEYLHTLQQRSKWTSTKPNIQKDTLVVIREDNTPPLAWKLGRVTSVSPGRDGIVRVVHLKTATGNLSRPVVKVSPLPLE